MALSRPHPCGIIHDIVWNNNRSESPIWRPKSARFRYATHHHLEKSACTLLETAGSHALSHGLEPYACCHHHVSSTDTLTCGIIMHCGDSLASKKMSHFSGLGKNTHEKVDKKLDNNNSNDLGISMHVIQLYLSFSLPLHGLYYPTPCFCCYRVSYLPFHTTLGRCLKVRLSFARHNGWYAVVRVTV